MTKTFAFIFFSLLLVSCGKGGGGGSNGEEVSLAEVELNAPVPQAALNFDVQLELANFSSSHERKVYQASELIKQVIASEEFKDRVIGHVYKGKKQFSNNNGLTNKQIYKKIIEGSEQLKPGKDNTMNLKLVSYYSGNTVVGYTYPHALNVWMNEKFLNQYSAAKITTNMIHEWLHKLGFDHDYESTPSRPYSVPYAVGYLVARLAARI